MADLFAPHSQKPLSSVLTELMERAFPAGVVPNSTYYGAFDACEQFGSDTPRRLVSIIDERYFDPEQHDSFDTAIDPVDLEVGFDKLFADVVSATQEQFGDSGHVVKGASIFDEEFFNFDKNKIVYWIRDQRIIAIHYATQYGDGDMQLLVSACAVPLNAAASGGRLLALDAKSASSPDG